MKPVWWFIGAAVLCGFARARRREVLTCGTPASDPMRLARASEEARARFEFDVVHREFANHAQKFDSTESSLGVITLVAVTLMAVYFADPKANLDRALEIALGFAAAIGCIGFMFFRGYEAFTAIEFHRDYWRAPETALHQFVDRMTELQQITKRALRAKQICGWISLSISAVVEIAVSVSRWHGP